MCLICVEFINQRMTRDEVRKALPEMIMFAKSEEDKAHFKKLQSLDSNEDFLEEVKNNSQQPTSSSKVKTLKS
jgi:hypothetical protein